MPRPHYRLLVVYAPGCQERERKKTRALASTDKVMFPKLDTDKATSLSTLEVLVHIYLAALQFEDYALVKATLARMRQHVLDRRHLDHKELLRCVRLVYAEDNDGRDSHDILRRILRSAVVIDNMDLIWG